MYAFSNREAIPKNSGFLGGGGGGGGGGVKQPYPQKLSAKKTGKKVVEKKMCVFPFTFVKKEIFKVKIVIFWFHFTNIIIKFPGILY